MREEEASKQNPDYKSQMDWSYSKRNCVFPGTIEREMTEVNGVERRTQALDDLRHRDKGGS